MGCVSSKGPKKDKLPGTPPATLLKKTGADKDKTVTNEGIPAAAATQHKNGRTSLKTLRPVVPPAPEYRSVLHRGGGRMEDKYTPTDRVLGKGSYGIVSVCLDKATGEELAAKTITKATFVSKEDLEQQLTELREEILIMDHLAGHPNVTTLRDTFEDAKHLHIIMDLCRGGTLYDIIADRVPIREVEAANLLRTMIKIVTHCHQRGVCHRDIKPENFMLSQRLEDGPDGGKTLEFIDIKIADFGLSTRYKQGPHEGTSMSERAGSPYFVRVQSRITMAPEVVRQSYGPIADIWSCGVILYWMLSGRYPFHSDLGVDGIFHASLFDPPDFAHPRWKHISGSAIDLVQRLLQKDPRQRITSQQVFSHAWIRAHAPGNSSIRASVPSESDTFRPSLTRAEAEKRRSMDITRTTSVGLSLKTDRSSNGDASKPSSGRQDDGNAAATQSAGVKVNAGSSVGPGLLQDAAGSPFGLQDVERHSTLYLPPREPADKARLDRFIETFQVLNTAYIQLLQAPDQPAVDMEKEVFLGALWILEKRFRADASPEEQGPFFFGQEPGLAESSTAPVALRMLVVLPRLRTLDVIEMCKNRGFTRMAKWLDAIFADPGSCCDAPILNNDYVVTMARKIYVTFLEADVLARGNAG